MAFKNYTTKIAATRTVGAIQERLAAAGCSDVAISYDPNVAGKPVAVRFAYKGGSYRLDANPEGVLKAMRRSHVPARLCNADQAFRVNWRVILDWLDSQLALMDAGAVTFDQVLMPWRLLSNGETFFERSAAMLALSDHKAEGGQG